MTSGTPRPPRVDFGLDRALWEHKGPTESLLLRDASWDPRSATAVSMDTPPTRSHDVRRTGSAPACPVGCDQGLAQPGKGSGRTLAPRSVSRPGSTRESGAPEWIGRLDLPSGCRGNTQQRADCPGVISHNRW